MKEEQRLLFINRSQEEIDEFKAAMPKEKFEIDTAESGKDAKRLIENNTYGVVILDMQLEEHDSEQIVKNLNRNYPDTICIIYTYNLVRAQLNFLLNECKVFRIFLSPANFLEEMYPAINEAFAVYANNFAMQGVDAIDRQLAGRKRSIREKKELFRHLQKGKKQLISFLEKIVLETIQMTDERLTMEEKKELAEYETELIGKILEVIKKPCSSVEEVKERLEEEFGGRKRCRKLDFRMPEQAVESEHRYFYEILYTAVWILFQQYWEVSNKNEAEVRMTWIDEKHLEIKIMVSKPKDMPEQKLQVAESAVRGLTENFEREEQKYEVLYGMRIKNVKE